MPLLPFWSRRSQPGDLTAGRGKGLLAPHFRIAAEVRNRHTHIIGRTGVGKSRLVESFLYQDIQNGLGGCCIDPHSSLIDGVLRYLITGGVLTDPTVRERLIYIQPTRTDYVIPFNVLATPDEPYMVASAVIEAFKRTWSSLGDAPNFTNVMRNSLLLLINTNQTLIDLPRLFEDTDWRDELLAQAADPNLTAFFHNRLDKWGRDGRLMLESSLNKVTEYILNPYLSVMLGQQDTIDLKHVMDSGLILFLDLGQLDPETRRLLGSFMVTLIELIMRKRENNTLWPLTIDEFAQFMASEGSATTLAHVLSEARKYGIGLCAAHQTLDQLTPKMQSALGNTDTRIVFGVSRYDAEWLSKVIGRVDTQAIKEEAKTDTQYTHYDPLPEQWEKWVDYLRLQPPRHAWVSSQNKPAVQIVTLNIPQHTASNEQVEAVKVESLKRYGISHDIARERINAGANDNTFANAPIRESVFETVLNRA